MNKLNPSDLLSLERYARERADFRTRVMAHKKNRQVSVGPNTLWLFEDRLTVQYQVQEMLRTERIFEAEGIADELAAYNPLIPEGRNWKATFLIEYTDPEVRRVQLEKLKGVEDRCWVQVAGLARLFAIADELAAYNPLIPEGRNWKVTFLIEYTDPEVRRVQLEKLKGVEDRCWVQVAGLARLFAIADEDLERANDVKTSAVHFLRFELTGEMVAKLKGGAALSIGIDHPNYQHELAPVADHVRAALLADLT
jgi:hypothetical protein